MDYSIISCVVFACIVLLIFICTIIYYVIISIKDIKRKIKFIRKLRDIEKEYDNADENTKEFVHGIFDIIEKITYSSSLQEYELWMGHLKYIVEELSKRTKAQ